MAKSISQPAGAKTEQLIRLSDVPSLTWLPLRRAGTRLHISTIYRWITTGADGAKLQAVRVGGVWCTRESWLQEFFSASAAAALKLRPQTDSAAQSSAERKLKAAGAM